MPSYTFVDFGEHIVITYDVQIDSKKCECEVSGNNFEITIPLTKNKSHSENLILYDDVEDALEIYNACDKLVIKLKKKNNSVWPRLLKFEQKEKDFFSSKISKFDHINKSREKIEKKEHKDDLNFFFQDIFGQGDEDSKRAMMKSFQESNGTCLSTDWKESKNKDYKEESKKYINT